METPYRYFPTISPAHPIPSPCRNVFSAVGTSGAVVNSKNGTTLWIHTKNWICRERLGKTPTSESAKRAPLVA